MNQDSSPDSDPGSPRRSLPLPLPVLGAVAGAIVIALVFVAVSLAGGGGGGKPAASAGVEHAGLVTGQPTVQATIDLTQPTAPADVNLNISSVSSGDRLIVSKYGINAPLDDKAVGLDGQMPNPDNPDEVVYYDFSAWPGKGGAPGKGGNAIFAGHVDSGQKACNNGTVPPPCEAVFWNISSLVPGDEVDVLLSGQTYRYRVTSNQPVSADNGPWDQIVSSTAQESITLITCGGDFNRDTHEYSNRQVVTAVRI